jgi:hypothetical protein
MRRALAVGLTFCFVALVEAAEPVDFTVGAFKFARPEGWGWVAPASTMRKAQLTPPATKEDELASEVTFFHFGPGQGGSADANVQRWANQFDAGGGGSNAAKRTEKIGGTEVTYVKATGTFSSGMPGGPTTPMRGFMLYGAILASAEGDVYVKMTGPQAAVEASIPAFERMIAAACQP